MKTRRLLLILLSAGVAFAMHTGKPPAPSGEAGPEDTSAAAAESLWIDQVLSGTAQDTLVQINTIRVLGGQPQVVPFIVYLLPVKTGQQLREKELEQLLAAHNRQMAGRTDWFFSYTAMVGVSDIKQNLRNIVVQA